MGRCYNAGLPFERGKHSFSMKNVKRAFWILLASGVAAAVFWAATADRTVEVFVAEVRLLDPHSSISTNGRVEAEQVYEVRAPAAGLVRSIQAREGAPVTAGQTLLTLDDMALRSELAAARSELVAAEVDLKNVRRGPPPEELNQAEAEVRRAELEVEAARKTLATN